jgi:endonuclease/exonuclease/phosphatase family metal-dependent hydrolase
MVQSMRIRHLLRTLAAALLAVASTTAAAGTSIATAEPQADDRPIRVMSFNIHHGVGTDGVLDLQRIADMIKSQGADIVGLQEVDRHWSERSNFVDQTAWLARELNMHVVYGANLDNDPLEPGQPRRQYGTAILSRYPIAESRNTLLPKYRGQERRGLLEATLKVRGTTLRFANIHLTNNNAERKEQSAKVAELLAGSSRPTVLVGDLNAVPTAPEITILTSRWKDTWPQVGEGPGYTIESGKPPKRIDYILHSQGIHPKSAEVLTTLASDHLPVVARLSVPG